MSVEIRRDGDLKETFDTGDMQADSNAAFRWMLRNQSMSVDWAIRYEGWRVTEIAPDGTREDWQPS